MAWIDFQPLTAFLGEDFMARLKSRLGCDGIGDQVSTLSTFGSLGMSGSQTDLSVLLGKMIFAVKAALTTMTANPERRRSRTKKLHLFTCLSCTPDRLTCSVLSASLAVMAIGVVPLEIGIALSTMVGRRAHCDAGDDLLFSR